MSNVYSILKIIHVNVSLYLQCSYYNYIYITIQTKIKFTGSVNALDTTSDESDQVDLNYTNHDLKDSNEEDVNIIRANDVMEISSKNGTQQELEDHSHKKDSVHEQVDECDDRNVDNTFDEEDRSKEDSTGKPPKTEKKFNKTKLYQLIKDKFILYI